jgi:primase-polymerase (primpol)-like protein
MTDGTLPPERSGARPTLADLGPFPRWVAWRTEPRRGGEKPTKVPYSPRGHHAGSNNPANWGRRAEAEAAFRRIGATEHGPGG